MMFLVFPARAPEAARGKNSPKNRNKNQLAWVHETLGMPEFEWQEGYGAFTVSPDRREAVKKYIERQVEHHRRTTFQEEYLRLLEGSGAPYNERYLW